MVQLSSNAIFQNFPLLNKVHLRAITALSLNTIWKSYISINLYLGLYNFHCTLSTSAIVYSAISVSIKLHYWLNLHPGVLAKTLFFFNGMVNGLVK